MKSPILPLIAALGLVACKTTSPIPNQLLGCAESVAPALIGTAGPIVGQILSGDKPDWQGELGLAITNLGLPAVECAVAQLVGDLTKQATTAALSPAQQVELVRAQAWLAGVTVAEPR